MQIIVSIISRILRRTPVAREMGRRLATRDRNQPVARCTRSDVGSSQMSLRRGPCVEQVFSGAGSDVDQDGVLKKRENTAREGSGERIGGDDILPAGTPRLPTAPIDQELPGGLTIDTLGATLNVPAEAMMLMMMGAAFRGGDARSQGTDTGAGASFTSQLMAIALKTINRDGTDGRETGPPCDANRGLGQRGGGGGGVSEGSRPTTTSG